MLKRIIGALALAGVCVAGAAENTKVDVLFARGKWSAADFIQVKSWRNTYVGSFDQRDDAIVNRCPELPGKEIFEKHCSDVYAALVHREKVPFGSTVSSRMAFDHRMAPLIAFAPALATNATGQVEFREHWEIVLYDRGLNVWHHYFENGEQKWFKAAALELPKGIDFQKDKVYDLAVQTVRNRRGRKEMIVRCGGYTLSYVDDALPDSFYAGIVGCEGRNLFYDFRVSW